MLNILRLLGLAALCVGCISCSSTKLANAKRINGVKTTAYTHSESDHLKYGAKAATGEPLKYGRVRSAATDWSVYPVGTVFKIDGEPYLYEVDDYGSALVGTNTIDLYKPSKSDMNKWGAKQVNISVLKWGSFNKSVEIMKPRMKYPHIQQMVKRIERSS
ncbi:MAG: 3D domain-containing protein [Roseimicrobium sp.]